MRIDLRTNGRVVLELSFARYTCPLLLLLLYREPISLKLFQIFTIIVKLLMYYYLLKLF